MLVGSAPQPLLDRLDATDLHAPHLLDVETLSVLRRLVLQGQVKLQRARQALADLRALDVALYAHEPLLDRILALRDNLSAYDASYVALSETLDLPLLTCDSRLWGAPGHAAAIELFTQTPRGP